MYAKRRFQLLHSSQRNQTPDGTTRRQFSDKHELTPSRACTCRRHYDVNDVTRYNDYDYVYGTSNTVGALAVIRQPSLGDQRTVIEPTLQQVCRSPEGGPTKMYERSLRSGTWRSYECPFVVSSPPPSSEQQQLITTATNQGTNSFGKYFECSPDRKTTFHVNIA